MLAGRRIQFEFVRMPIMQSRTDTDAPQPRQMENGAALCQQVTRVIIVHTKRADRAAACRADHGAADADTIVVELVDDHSSSGFPARPQ